MKYLDFHQALKPYVVFSLKDVEKLYPSFDRRRLVEWQEKGYIIKIKNGHYCFSELDKTESLLYAVANKIYKPSYVSLESALGYYGFIPEGVFICTSVTSKNRRNYENALGTFLYQEIKPALFFGYTLIEKDNASFKIAEPEKALLDFFYLRKPKDIEEIKALRLNIPLIHERLDFEKLSAYQSLIDNKKLDQRINQFKRLLHA